MDTREVKRRRCPNGHPGSKEKKVSKWTPRKWEEKYGSVVVKLFCNTTT